MFQISPGQAINEVAFTIKVKDNQGAASAFLDYEKQKVLNFTIVAKELNTLFESRVPVTVHLRDVNDNGPIFEEEVYSVNVREDITKGAIVAAVRARDADSGVFGTAGIRYTDLRGPMANSLTLDPVTGVIKINETLETSPFDR